MAQFSTQEPRNYLQLVADNITVFTCIRTGYPARPA